MKKFIVLYYMDDESIEKEHTKDSAVMKEVSSAWEAWMAKCGEDLLDMGSPLARGVKLTADSNEKSDTEVAGYSIIQAENMDAAKKLLEGHPHLDWSCGCSIELHESLPMGDM